MARRSKPQPAPKREEAKENEGHPCWNGKKFKHTFVEKVIDHGTERSRCVCGMVNFIEFFGKTVTE